MKLVPIEETDLTLQGAANLARRGTVILTRRGQPVAAIKSLSGLDWESVSLANNKQFRALIEESRRSYREDGGISLQELRRELGLESPQKVLKRSKKR